MSTQLSKTRRDAIFADMHKLHDADIYLTAADLAKRYGVSIQCIVNYRSTLGLHPKQWVRTGTTQNVPPFIPPPEPLKEPTQRPEPVAVPITETLTSKGRVVDTDKLMAEMTDLYARGIVLTNEELADRFDVGTGVIYRVKKALGIVGLSNSPDAVKAKFQRPCEHGVTPKSDCRICFLDARAAERAAARMSSRLQQPA